MVIPAPLHRYTYEQYVSFERDAGTKHEFLGGEIYAMTGGTPNHALLVANLIHLVSAKAPERCRVFSSDLRIRVAEADLATYPDVSVVCGKVELASDDPIAVVNPCILLEVTSPSTEHYDRNQKAEYYRTLPSLQQLIIVSHRQRLLTVHVRTSDGGWRVTESGSGQSIVLESLGAQLAVDEVYRGALEL